MHKFLPLLVISLFFISCTSKNNAFKHFQKENLQAKAIQYSKKTDILINNETDVIFWATYINNIDKKIYDLDKETFLVSVYFTNSQTQDIKKNKYDFTLNNQNLVSIKKVEKDDKDYSKFMLKNNWGNYYLIEFDKIKDSYKLKLKLFNQTSSQAQLEFEK